MGCKPQDFAAAFAGDSGRASQQLEDFTACALRLWKRGADVVILPGSSAGILMEGATAEVGTRQSSIAPPGPEEAREMWVNSDGSMEPSPAAGRASSAQRLGQPGDFRNCWPQQSIETSAAELLLERKMMKPEKIFTTPK